MFIIVYLKLKLSKRRRDDLICSLGPANNNELLLFPLHKFVLPELLPLFHMKIGTLLD